MGKKKLTAKQQRFVNAFDGDIRKASEFAGFSYGYGKQLMSMKKHTHVQEAIKKREITKSNRKILSREERQEWWSNMMLKAEKDSDKLKASELLGRSNADFTENKNIIGDVNLDLGITEEIKDKLSQILEG